jgi:hypothetical protein
METARLSGMGGALRATGTGTAGIFINPATLPVVRTYQIAAVTQITPEVGQWVVGGVVVDSVTSRLAGALSVDGTPISADPNGTNRTFLDARLALGAPLGDRLTVGVAGRYLKVDQSGVGPLGFSEVAGGLQDPNVPQTNRAAPSRLALVNAANFDVGLLLKLSENLFLAGVGQNLAYQANGFFPFRVGGGLGFSAETFTVEADGVADLNSWSTTASPKPTARVMVGGEYVVNATVPIRAGFGYDQGANLSTLSVGSGFVMSMFSAEASVKRTLASPGATTLTVGLAYVFDGGRTTARPADDL